MRSSERPAWIWALSGAWVSTTLLLLLPSATLASALCACWLAAGFQALGRARRRRVLATAVALLLPLQGFAAVHLQAQGPAHFHSTTAHTHVERHFHAASVDAIEVEHEHDRALTNAAQGKSAISVIDAASENIPVLFSRPDSLAVLERAFPPFPEYQADLLKRPPRLPA